jgi:arginase
VAPLLFPGARKIAEDRVALVGARALDVGERDNLDRSRVLRIQFDRERPDGSSLIAWARRRKIWLHFDVDVIDPAEFPAVAFPAIGGPPMAAVGDVLRQLAGVVDLRGISLCGYDARADGERALTRPIVDLVAAMTPRARVPA